MEKVGFFQNNSWRNFLILGQENWVDGQDNWVDNVYLNETLREAANYWKLLRIYFCLIFVMQISVFLYTFNSGTCANKTAPKGNSVG